MKKFWICVACACAVLSTAQLYSWAQSRGKSVPSVRAKQPSFSERDTAGVFFKDVFKEGLVGERPSNLSAPPRATPAGGGASSTDSDAGGGLYAWSKIISASTIENEIKAIKLKLDQDVTTPTKFKSRGYKLVRRHCSVAAALFAVAGEYDADVRWKEEAPGARDVFARTAGNAKTATDQVYNEAKLRRQDLTDMVAGTKFTVPNDPERKASWGTVCDRSPLMQRIETAQQGVLQPMIANAGEFKANKDKIIREAEMVAVIAEILKQEGMEDAGDSDYESYCDRMRDAALQIVEGAKGDDQAQANKGVGEIGKACSECHESYRA